MANTGVAPLTLCCYTVVVNRVIDQINIILCSTSLNLSWSHPVRLLHRVSLKKPQLTYPTLSGSTCTTLHTTHYSQLGYYYLYYCLLKGILLLHALAVSASEYGDTMRSHVRLNVKAVKQIKQIQKLTKLSCTGACVASFQRVSFRLPFCLSSETHPIPKPPDLDAFFVCLMSDRLSDNGVCL